MKRAKFNFYLFIPILILVYASVYGQGTNTQADTSLALQPQYRGIVEISPHSQSIFDTIPYLFEGRSIAYRGFSVNGHVYTSHTVRVEKVFRGDLKPGTVEIVLYGGFDKETGQGSSGEYILPYLGDYTWIFSAYNNKSFPGDSTRSFDNPITLFPNEQYMTGDKYIEYDKASRNRGITYEVRGRYNYGTNFEFRSDFYAFLKTLPNIRFEVYRYPEVERQEAEEKAAKERAEQARIDSIRKEFRHPKEGVKIRKKPASPEEAVRRRQEWRQTLEDIKQKKSKINNSSTSRKTSANDVRLCFENVKFLRRCN